METGLFSSKAAARLALMSDVVYRPRAYWPGQDCQMSNQIRNAWGRRSKRKRDDIRAIYDLDLEPQYGLGLI